MATALALVCVNPAWHVLECRAVFTPGDGQLHVKGLVAQEIRVTLMAAIQALMDLEDYVDGLDSVFEHKNLHINLTVPTAPKAAVVGDSYGLALTMAILGAASRERLPNDLIFAGAIGPAGEVLPVERMPEKRAAAAKLGFPKIMVPAVQLDMMNREIIQLPVRNSNEAYAVTFHG